MTGEIKVNKTALLNLSYVSQRLAKRKLELYSVGLAWILYDVLTKPNLLSSQNTTHQTSQPLTDNTAALASNLPIMHLIQIIH